MKIQMFQVVWRNKALLHVIKKRNVFLIYVLPRLDVGSHQLEIPSQYQKYKDVLGKKYVDTLPKQWSYDYTIDFKKGVQPPFGPIYNLSQDELIVFQ